VILKNPIYFCGFKKKDGPVTVQTELLNAQMVPTEAQVASTRIDEPILAIGVSSITVSFDNTIANVLTNNTKHNQLSVYTIPETGDVTHCASFKKPQGPVKSRAISAGPAYSIAITAISDIYLLWIETKNSKDWKTLAHTSGSLSHLTIHSMPE
jgi:hypothetical protein